MPAAGWRDGGDQSTSQRLDKSPQTQTRHDYRTVSDQNWTYIPNQFLCVHWSWWENSKQCIFSRLKKVYPTTSDMLSFASVRQLWNLPTSILLDLKIFLKKPQSIIHSTRREMFPTFCRSRSETWWRCWCWRRQTASGRTGWCVCTGRVRGSSCRCLKKLLQEVKPEGQMD